MLYLIGPDGLINLSFEDLKKMVWMSPRVSQNTHIVLIHAILGKFAYPRFTRYADDIRFYHKESLKAIWLSG